MASMFAFDAALGEGELAPRAVVLVVVLRAAGTLRLMFSNASRRSARKSGCLNVQLCRKVRSEEQYTENDKTYMFAILGIVRVFYFVKVILVKLPDKAGKVGVLEHSREDCLCELVHVLDHKVVTLRSPTNDMGECFVFEHPVDEAINMCRFKQRLEQTDL